MGVVVASHPGVDALVERGKGRYLLFLPFFAITLILSNLEVLKTEIIWAGLESHD